MHRGIDAFTDSNKHVHRSKSRLGTKGYLKGVVVDIAYDYLLLKNWNQYSSVDATTFISKFHNTADPALNIYPIEARDFVQRLKRNEVFTRYATIEGLEEALTQFDKRLPKRILARETTSSYIPILKNELTAIDRDFAHFFPELLSFFKSKETLNLNNHWML